MEKLGRAELKSHQSDSLDHVLDVAADGANCGQLLPVTPPFVHTKLRNTAQFDWSRSLTATTLRSHHSNQFIENTDMFYYQARDLSKNFNLTFDQSDDANNTIVKLNRRIIGPWNHPSITLRALSPCWTLKVKECHYTHLTGVTNDFPPASSYLFVFLAQQAELQVDVVELPVEFATGPFDHHWPPLQPHLDWTIKNTNSNTPLVRQYTQKSKTTLAITSMVGLKHRVLTIAGDVDSLTAENGLHSKHRRLQVLEAWLRTDASETHRSRHVDYKLVVLECIL